MTDGGTLTVHTAISPVGEALVSVRDNGPGIPQALHTRVFEPFFTTKPGTGTGLGLWVSDTIMRNHHGRLELDSTIDGDLHGTSMSMVLPLAAPPTP